MRIRSITVFTGYNPAHAEATLAKAAGVAASARKRLADIGYEVQTIRVALPPMSSWAGNQPAAFPKFAKAADAAAGASGIDYISLGPLIQDAGQDSARLDVLPEIFATTERIFTSAVIADTGGNMNMELMQHIARAVLRVSSATPNGFGNLRFAALAHCNSGIPFFPAAFAASKDFSFALATESADLALKACRAASSVSDAMARLKQSVEEHAAAIEPVMDLAATESGASFTGCDWSLAPHPDETCSIGAALEALTGAPFGAWGTLTAVAAMTRALRHASARRVGFSGVFLPVLEDSTFAQRATEHSYDLQRLVLYSSVCGAGVDTIPLAGDVSAESIRALLADVASLASVLKKPLTVRLLPVPGLKAGEKTKFNFPYLVNTRPLALEGGAPGLFRRKILSLGLF